MYSLKKLITFSLLLLISSYAFSAKFYKWTDEKGNTYYSDKVPEGQVEAEEVHVSTSRPSMKPGNTTTPQGGQNGSSGDAGSGASGDKDDQQAQIKEYCDGVRSNIKTLEAGGKIQSKDTEGNSKYLNEEEQKAKLKQYKLEESTRCQGV